MIHRFLIAAGMAALFVAGAAGADVTGKWTAQVPSPRGDMELTFNLTADGEKLTGTVANDFMGESEIRDGKIAGDEITFNQVMERGERKITFKFTGKVKGDEIEFTREFEGTPGGPGGGGPGSPRAGGTGEDRPRPDGPRAAGKRGGGFGRPATFTAKRAS